MCFGTVLRSCRKGLLINGQIEACTFFPAFMPHTHRCWFVACQTDVLQCFCSGLLLCCGADMLEHCCTKALSWQCCCCQQSCFLSWLPMQSHKTELQLALQSSALWTSCCIQALLQTKSGAPFCAWPVSHTVLRHGSSPQMLLLRHLLTFSPLPAANSLVNCALQR